MLTRNLSIALILSGSAALVGFSRAATQVPLPAAQSSSIKLADGPKVSDAEYMQHLRDARTHLEKAKAAFDADMPHREDRKDILEPIDKAINVIDDQIKAYEDGMKKK
jgi:hypothetical protein